MKNIYVLILFLFLFKTEMAQMPEIEDSIPSQAFIEATEIMFGKLDESKITSGILINRTMHLINISEIDGNNEEYIANHDTILELYSELRYSMLDMSETPDVFTLHSKAEQFNKAKKSIPLMLIHKEYEQFVENAYKDGLIGFEEEQFIVDYTSAGDTPYETKETFCIAPMISLNPYETEYTFVLPKEFLFTDFPFENISYRYSKMDVWENLSIGESITYYKGQTTSNIIYLKLQQGDKEYFSSFRIPSKSKGKWDPAPPPDLKVTWAKLGEVGVWFGCGNEEIRKPIIFIEGYDPDNTNQLETTQAEEEADKEDRRYNLYKLVNQKNMADDFRAKGYDIIILDYSDGLKEISLQAEIVRMLISFVNHQLLINGSNEELIIIGPSQGGLVTRYALSYIEEYGNKPHRVKLFVSFDSPQQGANIPLGIQHLIRYLYNSTPLGWLSKEIKSARKMLYSTPSKQMLVYHSSMTSNKKAKPAPEHTAFYNELEALNGGVGYPENCRKIAIANGSGNSTAFPFSTGSVLYFLDFLDASSPVKLKAIGRAINNNYATPKLVFQGEIFHNICYPWPFPCWVLNPVFSRTFKVKESKPYDYCPGGSNSLISDISIPDNLSFLGSFDTYINGFSFIPTTSALDLQNTSDLFYNVHANITSGQNIAYNVSDDISPFDAIFVSEQNESHIVNGVTWDIADYVEDNVMPNHLYLQNRDIVYDSDFEAQYTITAGKNVSTMFEIGGFELHNNSKVNFKAGNKITLKPGFNTIGGKEFKASIEDMSCNKSYNSGYDDRDEYSRNLFPEKELLSKIVEDAEKEIVIYPNPSKGKFVVSYNRYAKEDILLRVYSITGTLVYQSEFFKKTMSIDLSNQKKGLYFLHMYVDNKLIKEKFVIQ